MENSCTHKACHWLLLIAVVVGFGAIYKLLAGHMAASDVEICKLDKELALEDKGDLMSFDREGNELKLVFGKAGEGVYNAYTVDGCTNKITSKVVVRTK